MRKGIILANVSTKEQEEYRLSIGEILLPKLKQYAIDTNLEVVRVQLSVNSRSKGSIYSIY